MSICFVCFDFRDGNLRKQPWRYVHELALAFEDEAIVLTDCEPDTSLDIDVKHVPQLWTPTGPAAPLLDALGEISPDVVVSLTGATTCLRPRTLATELDCPTIGLFGSSVYDFGDIARIGFDELKRNFGYVSGHLLGAAVPEFALRRSLSAYHAVLVQTDTARDQLRAIAPSATVETVRTGISNEDLEIPTAGSAPIQRLEADVPSVLYFTSPLTLRGTDTLVRAMAKLDESVPGELVILSRQDGGGLSDEEQYLTELADELGIRDRFHLVAKNLTPEGIRQCLSAATVVSLPYKLVLSNVPISILETMAVGTPVVTTRVDGLPEIVDESRQLVPPADSDALARTLETILTNEQIQEELGQHNRTRMEEYDRWDDSRARLVELVEGAVDG